MAVEHVLHQRGARARCAADEDEPLAALWGGLRRGRVTHRRARADPRRSGSSRRRQRAGRGRPARDRRAASEQGQPSKGPSVAHPVPPPGNQARWIARRGRVSYPGRTLVRARAARKMRPAVGRPFTLPATSVTPVEQGRAMVPARARRARHPRPGRAGSRVGMKVLLTGADGYIGVIMGPKLIEAGHEVIGLDTGFYRRGWLFDDRKTASAGGHQGPAPDRGRTTCAVLTRWCTCRSSPTTRSARTIRG